MNLENLNLVDINTQEIEQIQGGVHPVVVFFALSLAYDICSNWNFSCKSFMARYNTQI